MPNIATVITSYIIEQIQHIADYEIGCGLYCIVNEISKLRILNENMQYQLNLLSNTILKSKRYWSGRVLYSLIILLCQH